MVDSDGNRDLPGSSVQIRIASYGINMSETQQQQPQNGPDCDVMITEEGTAEKWCMDDPATMFHLPNEGKYIYVCNVHIPLVRDQHPEANEIGL